MFISRRRRESKPGVQIPTAGQVAANLFGAGEQGLMLSEFNTLTNLFQDAPGTIPVTAVGQPVGRVLDLSGRGNFATFSNCTLQQDGGGRNYLAFNGTTTGGLTASIDFTATAQMTVWAGVMKGSDAAVGILVESGINSGTVAGSFAIFAPGSAGPNYVGRSSGTSFALTTNSGWAAPITNVLTLQGDIPGSVANLRVNGTGANSASTQGTGNYANQPIYIGRRAGTSGPFTGSLYSLIVRGASTTAPLVSSTELYVNSKTGAF